MYLDNLTIKNRTAYSRYVIRRSRYTVTYIQESDFLATI